MFKKLEWKYHSELNRYAGSIGVHGMVYEQVSEKNRWHFLEEDLNQRFVLIMIAESKLILAGIGGNIDEAMEYLREGEGDMQEYPWGLNEVITEIAAQLGIRGLGLELMGIPQQLHLTSNDNRNKFAIFINDGDVFYLVDLGTNITEVTDTLRIIGTAPGGTPEGVFQ